MTTKVMVDAHAGWPVRVTKIYYKPGEETGREDVIVPAHTTQDFYIHNNMRIAVEEMEMPRSGTVQDTGEPHA